MVTQVGQRHLLRQCSTTWEMVATQGGGRLCRWDGRQAGFLEEVTLGRTFRQLVTKSQPRPTYEVLSVHVLQVPCSFSPQGLCR